MSGQRVGAGDEEQLGSGPRSAEVAQRVDGVRRPGAVDVDPADPEPRVGRGRDHRHQVAVLGRADPPAASAGLRRSARRRPRRGRTVTDLAGGDQVAVVDRVEGAAHHPDPLGCGGPGVHGRRVGWPMPRTDRAAYDSDAQGAPHRGGQMQKSSGRILTSHAGSLPRPDDLIEAQPPASDGRGRESETAKAAKRTSSGVQQRRRGSGCAPAGGPASTWSTTASTAIRWATVTTSAPWWTYVFQRLGGLEMVAPSAAPRRRRRGRGRGRSPARWSCRRSPSAGTGCSSATPTATRNSGVALPNRENRPSVAGLPRADHLHRARGAGSTPSPTSRQRWPPPGWAEGFLNAVGPGQLRALRQRLLPDR